MRTDAALNVKIKDGWRAYMLRKVKVLETTLSVIDDLLYNEIKEDQDRMRVNSYKRGLNKAIHTLRYS